MLYREIIAVCSEIHTKHINTLCGQNVEFLKVNLVVHIVTTGGLITYLYYYVERMEYGPQTKNVVKAILLLGQTSCFMALIYLLPHGVHPYTNNKISRPYLTPLLHREWHTTHSDASSRDETRTEAMRKNDIQGDWISDDHVQFMTT
jgi:hypothetical protein